MTANWSCKSKFDNKKTISLAVSLPILLQKWYFLSQFRVPFAGHGLIILTSSTIDKKLENFEFIFEFKIATNFEFNFEIFCKFRV